jgi:hypothetical protein
MIHLDTGDASEARIVSELIKAGWKVAVVWNQNCRYDLIGDCNSKLFRIQCKTAWIERDSVLLYNARSTNKRTNSRYTPDEVDLFAVYSPDTDKVYIVPCNKASSGLTLRLKATKNAQRNKIHWAKDYELKANKTKTRKT